MYVVCCHWYPPTRDAVVEWVRQQYLLPIGEHLNRLKRATIYVVGGGLDAQAQVCCHWLPGLLDYVKETCLRPALERALAASLVCHKGYIRVKQVQFMLTQLIRFSRLRGM